MRNSELDSELLSQVRELFQSVENQIKAATGYGFDALTESEARYLAKHDNAQSIRDRIIAAGSTASLRMDERSTRFSKGANTTGLTTTQVTSKDQSDAILLNRTMANHFKDESWSNAYEQVDLPDTLSQYAAAASAAFDAPIVAIRPTDARFDQFNGINVARRNYVNVDADTSFINITGHEIYRDLEHTRPDFHVYKGIRTWLRANGLNLKLSDNYIIANYIFADG